MAARADTRRRRHQHSGGSPLTAPAVESDAGTVQLPVWTKTLGWCGVAGLIYLLVCAVSVIGRGFAGLGSDAAHTMFAFAANPWVGLSVGILGTVLIQRQQVTQIPGKAQGKKKQVLRSCLPPAHTARAGGTIVP
ncbi:hypothetical protein [Streptomyces sp. NPDC058751]|uniref:hypothetical protein n=1 Tax=Streptomyces sp. NPDC058751 TaxID=3346623 RepID=UPI0036C320CF